MAGDLVERERQSSANMRKSESQLHRAPMTGKMSLFGGGMPPNTTEPSIFIIGASAVASWESEKRIAHTRTIGGLRNLAQTLIEICLSPSADRRAELMPQAGARQEAAWAKISERSAPDDARTKNVDGRE
ncbi:hypothetical protein C8R43DRAFT_1111719 [Mycena crocata]|nr:hypothetical protein C8R43DRAFT_1111719 [Mycena crocata]